MASVVYFMCAVTSLGCATLLVRQWRASRIRLLMWSALGFSGLALNNVLLFADRVAYPDRDLLLFRALSGLISMRNQ
jgi:hypothetical protein